MSESEHIVILVGSPRAEGVSAHLAQRLEDLAVQEGHDVVVMPIADTHIEGCTGCDACKNNGSCIIDDDMPAFRAAIDDADVLYVVAPVYFAAPPSQFKALLDRLQPHYWLNTRAGIKRPAHLFAVGEGGDPWGTDAWHITCSSALSVAGFHVSSSIDCIAGDVDAALDEFNQDQDEEW